MPVGKLLTQDEVADILECSTSTIKRLRQTGRLAYIPGRPVLIDEADLAAYQETLRREEPTPKVEKTKAEFVPPQQSPAKLARLIWLARQNSAHERAKRRQSEEK
ncbi:DNA-binding protein [Mesorhizobium sp. M00.F.Ca.ET.170.01.1.1]|nr:DNA-binding protein [Mesorhizobium sp. M00.F.Ca.ET.170.01.1.1]